ncbi:MAG: tetratricopeptide repeat protein 39 [Acidobacteria bacterium]|nr:tetratricopeptide repeat protein 39 [Acidobacteriota bacterium]
MQTIVLGVLLLFAMRVHATETHSSAARIVAVSADSQRELHVAFEALYNLDFESSKSLFRHVAAAEPESATVRAFLASALLYEMLAEQRKLQSQLFQIDNAFLHQPRLPPDPELERSFQRAVEESQQLARQRLKKNQADADALFALGLSYANLANYAAGVEGQYLQGFRHGQKAYMYHKMLRQLHPQIHDTGVVLGAHEYVLGSLSSVKRFFLFFLGARGNRERGLEYLREAAEHGEFLRTYARVLLAVAWIREGQPAEARRLLEGLRADYPRNPLFLFELGHFYREQRNYSQATEAFRELLAELSAHPLSPRLLGPEDALLELGRVEAAAGNLEAALEAFRKIEQVPDARNDIVASTALERGRIFDLQGMREKALTEYEKVIRLAVDPDAVSLARTYRKDPYRGELNSSPKGSLRFQEK